MSKYCPKCWEEDVQGWFGNGFKRLAFGPGSKCEPFEAGSGCGGRLQPRGNKWVQISNGSQPAGPRPD